MFSPCLPGKQQRYRDIFEDVMKIRTSEQPELVWSRLNKDTPRTYEGTRQPRRATYVTLAPREHVPGTILYLHDGWGTDHGPDILPAGRHVLRPTYSCPFVVGNQTGTSKVSFAEEEADSSTERRRMATTSVASSPRPGEARSSKSSVHRRRLASIETVATVGVGSIQVPVNGRPSGEVPGVVTRVRFTSTDDGSVRVNRTDND